MKNAITLLLFLACLSIGYSQAYEGSPCKCCGNPALKYIKKGDDLGITLIEGLNGTWDNWASSFLEAEGKAPEKPAANPPGNSDEAMDAWLLAKEEYDAWTCMYSAGSLTDGDINTCWAEGEEGENAGDLVIVNLNVNSGEFIRIRPGLAKSDELFNANGRPEHIEVFIMEPQKVDATQGGMVFSDLKVVASGLADLDDENKWQTIRMPEFVQSGNYYLLGIRVMSVYKGSKYSDICISEVKKLR